MIACNFNNALTTINGVCDREMVVSQESDEGRPLRRAAIWAESQTRKTETPGDQREGDCLLGGISNERKAWEPGEGLRGWGEGKKPGSRVWWTTVK